MEDEYGNCTLLPRSGGGGCVLRVNADGCIFNEEYGPATAFMANAACDGYTAAPTLPPTTHAPTACTPGGGGCSSTASSTHETSTGSSSTIGAGTRAPTVARVGTPLACRARALRQYRIGTPGAHISQQCVSGNLFATIDIANVCGPFNISDPADPEGTPDTIYGFAVSNGGVCGANSAAHCQVMVRHACCTCQGISVACCGLDISKYKSRNPFRSAAIFESFSSIYRTHFFFYLLISSQRYGELSKDSTVDPCVPSRDF